VSGSAFGSQSGCASNERGTTGVLERLGSSASCSLGRTTAGAALLLRTRLVGCRLAVAEPLDGGPVGVRESIAGEEEEEEEDGNEEDGNEGDDEALGEEDREEHGELELATTRLPLR